MVGTALLRAPEAGIAPAWAASLDGLSPEDTMLTRGFSGRTGRAIASDFVRTLAEQGPEPAPYPVQRALTQPMRNAAARADDPRGMQMWAGQAAARARAEPAAQVVARIWAEALAHLLPDG
jgi:nitronate monooxygenase